MPPIVCIARSSERLSETRWRVSGWAYDAMKPGTFVEQTRVDSEGMPQSLMVWEIIEPELLEAQGFHQRLDESCQCFTPAPTSEPAEVQEGDWFLWYSGELPAYKQVDCPDCDEYLGFGDLVEAVTKKFGIEPCESCEERKRRWNAMWPKVVKK